MRWTEAAVRARLSAAGLIESQMLPSSHAFAEARLELLTIIASVDSGTITASEAAIQFDAISNRLSDRGPA